MGRERCSRPLLSIAVLAGETVAPAPRAIDPQPGAARLLVERLPGTESCPSDDELKDAVARRLGFDPFHPRATREIRCTVRRADGSFRARIEIGGSSVAAPATGRDLISRGDDCAELAEALELAVGIAINPLVIARSTATRPPPKATLPAPPTAKGAPLAMAALPPRAVPPPSAAPAPMATPPPSATTPPAEIARDAARSPRPSVTPPASGLTQASVPRSLAPSGSGPMPASASRWGSVRASRPRSRSARPCAGAICRWMSTPGSSGSRRRMWRPDRSPRGCGAPRPDRAFTATCSRRAPWRAAVPCAPEATASW